jgi:hypothetical protein
MVKSVAGAVSLVYVLPCLGLVAFLAWRDSKRQSAQHQESNDAENWTWTEAWQVYRPAIFAGFILLTLGIGIYAPIGGVAGRYTIPAVWGLDLWLGVVLMLLVEHKSWRNLRARSTARLCFAGCLLLLAVINVGKQGRYAARADVLWQALEFIEQRGPCRVVWAGTPVAAYQRPPLGESEGVHFQWHLEGRGHTDCPVQFVNCQQLTPPPARVSPGSPPTFAISGTPDEPRQQGWRLVKEFRSSYWLGWRNFHCFVWTGG